MRKPVYAGISRARLEVDHFDFGHGVKIRPVYAYLFSAPMMTFKKAELGKPHPAPWRAATGGGYSHHIEAELSVSASEQMPSDISDDRAIGLIASLLRLQNLTLTVPVLADLPLDEASTAGPSIVLTPFETGNRLISYHDEKNEIITAAQLKWVQERWPLAAKLAKSNADFDNALSACDNCIVEGRTASSLMLAWGALEGLFAKGGRSEATHRVSAYIAAYNCPAGATRLKLFKDAKRLYAARSSVAHSAADGDVSDLLETFLILRNSLIRILDSGQAPTLDFLEQRLFGKSDEL